MASLLDRVYRIIPTWAQHFAVSAYGLYWHWLRFGGDYPAILEEYRSRDDWSPAEWRAHQQEQLLSILPRAADSVPFYRQHWNAEEQRAARNGRLEGLPLLEKDAVREEPRAFLREDMSARSGKTYHTSGTTGTPIATMWKPREIRRSRAVREARSNAWAGVSFDMPRATFSGRMVEPDPDSAGPYYRYNMVEKQVYFSAFHLRPDTAPQYVAALRKHGVRWLSGYAVSFYLLASHILEQGLSVPPLDAVITTSEKVTPAMRDVMEEAYGCGVYEEYSSVENIMLATECGAGKLHVSPDVGVVEILGPDGSRCEPGEPGEVAATGFLREWQPLIRYRMGDVAAWDDEPCSCGRGMPVLKEVVGRLEDVVIGPDGRELVRFHGLFVDQPNVKQGQVIQEALDRMRVRVVVTDEFGPSDIEDLEARVHARLGVEVEVAIEPVSEIPRTAGGKYKAVISHVSSDTAVAGSQRSDASGGDA